MNTASTPRPPLTNGASPVVQFSRPGEVPPMIPAIMATPMMRNTTTVMTLMAANQNSPSPNARADSALSRKSSSRNPADQTMAGTSGNQKRITSAAATSSAATVIAQLNQ